MKHPMECSKTLALQLLVLAAISMPLPVGSRVDGSLDVGGSGYHWWIYGNCSELGVEPSEAGWFYICWVSMATMQSALLVIGLGNNTLNLICLRRDTAHATQNVLLLSLAACDWLIVLIMSVDTVCHISGNVDGVPMWLHWTCTYLHPFPITGLQFALLTVHGWTTVALAASRCLMVSFPLQSRSWVTRQRLSVIAGLVWLAGIATGVPRLTDTFAVVCTNRKASMVIGRSYFPVYSTVHTWALQVVVPVALCILLNVHVAVTVARNKQPASSLDERVRQAKVTRMVFGVTLIYVVCQSFSVFFFLNTVISWKRAAFEMLDLTGNLVYSLDASLSFFVYIYTNDNFKSEVRSLLGLRRRDNHQTYTQSASGVGGVGGINSVA